MLATPHEPDEPMMPDDPDALTIRRAAAADAEPLAELALRSFVDAYAALNDPDDVAAYTARVYGPAQQAAEIANPDIVTLIGELDGRMVAYAQVRRGTTAPGVTDPDAVEIMRFYVDKPWHGRGVAQRMMKAVLRTAREQGAPTVWLAVWERSPWARAFYAKSGFHAVGKHVFWLGSACQDDLVLTRATHVDDG